MIVLEINRWDDAEGIDMKVADGYNWYFDVFSLVCHINFVWGKNRFSVFEIAISGTLEGGGGGESLVMHQCIWPSLKCGFV